MPSGRPWSSPVGRVGGVLDQGDPVLDAERTELVDRRRVAAEMHGDDRLRARRDPRLDVGRVEHRVGSDRRSRRTPARAPQYTAAFAVATNVIDGTITSSPGPTPAARYARCSAAVHDEVAIACRTPRCSANASSNAWILGPIVSQPDRSASVTAAKSSSSSTRSNRGMTSRVVAVIARPDDGCCLYPLAAPGQPMLL